jgi:hypothetical protein
LKKNGLAILQPTDIGDGGALIVSTYVFHAASQQYVASLLQMPLSKVDPQGVGSGISYARRYALQSILEIVTQDEDDDGNAASGDDAPSTKAAPKGQPEKTAAEMAAEGAAEKPKEQPEKSAAERAAEDPLVQETLKVFPGAEVAAVFDNKPGAAPVQAAATTNGPARISAKQVNMACKRLEDKGYPSVGKAPNRTPSLEQDKAIGLKIVDVPKSDMDNLLAKILVLPKRG